MPADLSLSNFELEGLVNISSSYNLERSKNRAHTTIGTNRNSYMMSLLAPLHLTLTEGTGKGYVRGQIYLKSSERIEFEAFMLFNTCMESYIVGNLTAQLDMKLYDLE